MKSRPWKIFANHQALMDDCKLVAQQYALNVELIPFEGFSSFDFNDLNSKDKIAFAFDKPISVKDLTQLSKASQKISNPLTLFLNCESDETELTQQISSDLGIICANAIRPFFSVLSILTQYSTNEMNFSFHELEESDKTILQDISFSSAQAPLVLQRLSLMNIGIKKAENESIILGEARDLKEAFQTIQGIDTTKRPSMPTVENMDMEAVRDVLFGPSRTLSDPASKTALILYDLPILEEQLCFSPSRVASECNRFGYPVRLSLNSPDFLISDHPDLTAEPIFNANQAKDAYRQLLALAHHKNKEARVLGISVSAPMVAKASLEVSTTSIEENVVLAKIRFANPHGQLTHDEAFFILPATKKQIQRALLRLESSDLIFDVTSKEKSLLLENFVDTFHRLAAFTNEWRNEVEKIKITSLAIVPSMQNEIREARIQVTNFFEKQSQTKQAINQ